VDSSDCIICKLLSGELEVTFVHQDELCSAFMDLHPINPGHMLVVPNRHAPHVKDLTKEEAAQIFRLARRLATALRASGLKCEGVNFFLADGEAAGQEVFHAHLHIFPRYRGDGFSLTLPPGYGPDADREGLNEAAQKIRDRFLQ
jgi:histidine triad (HIT) family protein